METKDYDTQEKIMQALEISIDACKEKFRNKQVIQTLKNVLKQLNKEISEEEDIDHKSYLQDLRIQLDQNILRKLT